MNRTITHLPIHINLIAILWGRLQNASSWIVILCCIGLGACQKSDSRGIQALKEVRLALRHAKSATVTIQGYIDIQPSSLCNVALSEHGADLESSITVKRNPYYYPNPKISSEEKLIVVLHNMDGSKVKFEVIGGLGIQVGPNLEYHAQLYDSSFEEKVLDLCRSGLDPVAEN